MARSIRIGNSSGFWGDEPDALKRQLKNGDLDYLTADYLAEVSMSILRKQQNRNPDLGYVPDFVEHLLLAAEEFKNSPTKIITNAGGNNPIQCAKVIDEKLKEQGIEKKIIAISGDNILDRVDQYYMEGVSFENTEDGRPFSRILKSLQSANVYTGSASITKALSLDADIVIAGRIADSALTVGPLVHEFKWRRDDWDKLASAMIAGHIIECGAQASGGNFTDWKTIDNWRNMGFPVIEMHEDGQFIVTKTKNSGGLVNEFTVKEQLVYEIADPRHYYGPDVVADITSVRLEDLSNDRVKVSKAKGKPAPHTWKVSMSYHSGYKSSGSLILSGPDALEKAELLKAIFWDRLETNFEKIATNFIGYNACHQGLAAEIEPNEILVQFTAFDHDRDKLDRFSKHLSSMILSSLPGLAVTGGRPRIQEVIRYWPALIHKKIIKEKLFNIVSGHEEMIAELIPEIVDHMGTMQNDCDDTLANHQPLSQYDHSQFVKVKMRELCLARSGDKGDMVNLGIIARNSDIYQWIKNEITEAMIKELFGSLCKGEVKKYSLDNLLALNFTLDNALDGGGTYSGRIDPQGKTFASAFLGAEVSVPREILPKMGRDKMLNE